jgi:CheY-like chemotaxis protein
MSLDTPMPSVRTVLIVDDEPTIRMIARTALVGAGFTVTEVGDSSGALEAARKAVRPFDLILLDLTLPGGSGADLLPELRELCPGSRIMLVSGLLAEEAADLGADGFLGKPFTRATLLSAVQTTLAKSG